MIISGTQRSSVSSADHVAEALPNRDARMQVGSPFEDARRMRALVAIASYGEKNLEFLKAIIRKYRGMAMDVDLVVNSEAAKNLEGARVVAGLPSRNPHSLPFAHKQVFAENADKYDLFVYTEDDIGVREENIQAFLKATAVLEPDEIAGFIRYEIDADGAVSIPDFLGPFHWRPESVRRRGELTIAEFTNEHAGFYILTQAQLWRAISSGGFLQAPYEGRYGMLETAATDPYTSCGLRRVVCLSAIDNFLIHHLPNRYVGVTGIPLATFKEQIRTLLDIHHGDRPATTLCEVEPKVFQQPWSKSYHERPYEEVLRMVPTGASTILSLGCGWGATELRLIERGCQVTALPLNSVVGASAERLGMEVIYGTMDECARDLNGRRFDAVLLTHLLHLLPDPWGSLKEFARFVADRGTLVIAGYNFDRLPDLAKRVAGVGEYGRLNSFEQSGIHVHGIREVIRQIERLNFRLGAVTWFEPVHPERLRRLWYVPERFVARNWVLQAQRHNSCG